MDGIVPRDGNSLSMKNDGPKSYANGCDNNGQRSGTGFSS